MLQCKKPMDRNSTGFSNTNDRETIIRAKYIIVNGISIASDFVPETFGRLTTLGPVFWVPTKQGSKHRQLQVCQCSCGTTRIVYTGHLKSGHTQSCGCVNARRVIERNKKRSTHNESHKTPEHGTWAQIQTRCYNPNHESYKSYGGRGIRVCDRWREPGKGYFNFLEDMGRKPSPSHTIDRYPDPDGNYEPGNCRWASPKEQGRNKRNNAILTAFGKTQCMAAWAEEYSLHPATLHTRIKAGWDVEKAIATKPKRKGGNG